MKISCLANSDSTLERTEIKEGRFPARPGDLPAFAPISLRSGSETAAPWGESLRGWILYDAECRSCTSAARRFDRILRRRGFHFLALPTPWVEQRLGLQPGAPLEEMRVVTSDGADFGGADAVIFLARKIWWAWPFYAVAQIPGTHCLIDLVYRWIAAHRGCNQGACAISRSKSWPG